MDKIKVEAGKILIPRSMFRPEWRNQFPGIRWAGKAKGYWYLYADQKTADQLGKLMGVHIDLKPQPIIRHLQFPFKMEPYGFQHDALNSGYGRLGYGYLFDPGMGKTKTIIDEIQILERDGAVDTAIIFTTKSMLGSWVRQIKTHGYWENWRIYQWGRGMINDPARCSLRWFIVNIDAIRDVKYQGQIWSSEAFRMAWELLNTSGKAYIAIDESTSIKNVDAERTQKALLLRRSASYRRIATGTMMEHPMDVYSQLLFLDPSIVYDWDVNTFRDHFCIMGGHRVRNRPVQIIGYTNKAELAAMISANAYQARKADHMDLPGKVYEIREIELSEKTRNLYDKVAKGMILDLKKEVGEGGKINSNMVLARMTKLRQICGGMLIDVDGTVIDLKEDSKLLEIQSIIEEGAKKTVVWCQFRHEIFKVRDFLTKLGRKVVVLYGDMNAVERDQAWYHEFERGNADDIVVQNDTGGEGIELLSADTHIFYTNSQKARIRIQSEDRSHRSGLSHPVTYHDLLVNNSVDVTVYKANKKKQDTAEYIYSIVKELTGVDKAFFNNLDEEG